MQNTEPNKQKNFNSPLLTASVSVNVASDPLPDDGVSLNPPVGL